MALCNRVKKNRMKMVVWACGVFNCWSVGILHSLNSWLIGHITAYSVRSKCAVVKPTTFSLVYGELWGTDWRMRRNGSLRAPCGSLQNKKEGKFFSSFSFFLKGFRALTLTEQNYSITHKRTSFFWVNECGVWVISFRLRLLTHRLSVVTL